MFARSHSAHGTGYYSLYAALTVGESRILHFPNILQRPRMSALHSRFSTTQTVGKFEGKPHYPPKLHSGKSDKCPVDTYGGARAVERYIPRLFTSASEQVGFSALEGCSRSTCSKSLPAPCMLYLQRIVRFGLFLHQSHHRYLVFQLVEQLS